jgi:hypothetical protein
MGLTLFLSLAPAFDQHLLDIGDRFSGIQSLGTGPRAIENGVASIEPERIFEIIEPLTCSFVAAIDDPAGRLKENSGSEEPVAIPPVTRAARGAAETENALV